MEEGLPLQLAKRQRKENPPKKCGMLLSLTTEVSHKTRAKLTEEALQE